MTFAGLFTISKISSGDPSRLTDDERETIDAVLEAYGDKSAQWLSELTHRERPWREARRREGLTAGERGNAVITPSAMAEFYGGFFAIGGRLVGGTFLGLLGIEPSLSRQTYF